MALEGSLDISHRQLTQFDAHWPDFAACGVFFKLIENMTLHLILSVGSLVRTNILDAVQSFRPYLRVIGIKSDPEAHNNFRCDRVFLASAAQAHGGTSKTAGPRAHWKDHGSITSAVP
jgi:hypothetical protein